MRHVGDGLGYFPESGPCQLIQQNGKYDRERETEKQQKEVDGNRISHGTEKVRISQEGLEMLQSHKITSENPFGGNVIEQGYNHPVHGIVMINKEICENR